MPEPYTAVGLIPSVRGVRKREQIQRNLDHLAELIAAASWLSSLDLPVKLVLLPEGALQGFTDEVFDLDHATYAGENAIDIPGPETRFLGELARHWNVFLMGQAKARHEAFPERFFNVGFAIDPNGEVILKHYKLATLYPVEHSVTPHDVWDRWVQLYGRTLQAFFPVVDTPIGRLAVLMANEGSYPENARGLAMNGAEVVYRGSYPHPHTGNDFFAIQNRARALDNNFYVVAPNLGTYYLEQDSELPIDAFGGGSMIVDYKGRIVGQQPYGGSSTYMAGTIDINALRHFRVNAQWDNWMKDLRTELFQLVYERPIYPANLYVERPPFKHAEYRQEVIDRQIDLLVERDIWRRPTP
jgi:predicted amidohydrolase